MLQENYNSKFVDIDDLIIGSGAGGFTVAAALAQAGRKVLIVEQHKIPGGWSQSYQFGGHSFSPGVHDIAELGEGGRLKQIYEGLSMGPYLAFNEMNPESYDHILVGNERFDVPAGKEKIIEHLSGRFPQEKTGIIKYFSACEKIWHDSESVADINNPAALVKSIIHTPLPLRWSLNTGEQFVNAFIKDPLLKAMLYGQAAGHYALPPSQVSAVIHAAAVGSYINGSWHPRGGARTIVRAFIQVIRKNGGNIITGHKVEKIILSNRKAVAVKLDNGTEIQSKNIISNADPAVTFSQLVGPENLSSGLKKKLKRIRYSLSGLCLSIVTDNKLDTSSLDSGNYWYYDTTDIDGVYKKILTDAVPSSYLLPFICLTTNSLRDPQPDKHNTLAFEAFTFMRYDHFKEWEKSSFGDRPKDYILFKQKLTQSMLNTIDRIIPSFSKHVTATELATPLTNVHYIMSTGGNFYGTEKRAVSKLAPGAILRIRKLKI